MATILDWIQPDISDSPSHYFDVWGGSGVISTSGGTFGRKGFWFNNSGGGYNYKSFPNGETPNIVSFFKRQFWTRLDTQEVIFAALDGGTVQMAICVLNTGQIRATIPFGVNLGTSATAPIQKNGTVYAIQGEIKIGNGTSGYVKVWVNGALVLDLQNVDTQQSANAFANQWGDGFTFDGKTTGWTDFIVGSGAGPIPDMRVDTLRPTGAGDSTQFTPSAGSNWQNVDETGTPSEADINSSPTVGNLDLFAHSDLSGSGTIHAIRPYAFMNKSDAGAKSAQCATKTGTTVTNHTARSLSTTLQLHLGDVLEQNPDTVAAWNETTVNATQAGYKVAA